MAALLVSAPQRIAGLGVGYKWDLMLFMLLEYKENSVVPHL